MSHINVWFHLTNCSEIVVCDIKNSLGSIIIAERGGHNSGDRVNQIIKCEKSEDKIKEEENGANANLISKKIFFSLFQFGGPLLHA